MDFHPLRVGIIITILICSSQARKLLANSPLRIHPLDCINALSDMKDMEDVMSEVGSATEELLGNLVTLVLSTADCVASFPWDLLDMLDCFIDVLEDSGPNTELFLHMFYNLTVSSQQVYQEVTGNVRKCIGDYHWS